MFRWRLYLKEYLGFRGLGFRVWVEGFTWTPKVCEIMAFVAVIMGLGLPLYVLLEFRYSSKEYLSALEVNREAPPTPEGV